MRLLRELHERGTITAVADALNFTPSAVSQQLAVLEREAGVKLVERAGRGVRLTDSGHVLAGHAAALLERADQARTDLAAAAGAVRGRGRIAAFQSVSLHIAAPAMASLSRGAPGLRCELIEAEPEAALPELVLGDLDLVLADEWPHQPRTRPTGVDRHELLVDAVRIALPADHRAALAHPRVVRLEELSGEHWVCGHAGMGWSEITVRTCREHGGFDPLIRHRTNDAFVGLKLTSLRLAVSLVPDLVGAHSHPGVAVRDVADVSLARTVFAATRAVDARRPSIRALLGGVQAAAAVVAASGRAEPTSARQR